MGRVSKKGTAYQPSLVEPVDPYPQHTRLHPFFQENWALREFMAFLAERGQANLTFEQVNTLILDFRGVDAGAYEAEAAAMRQRYGWLWNKYDQGSGAVPEVVEDQIKQDDGLSLLMARVRGSHGEDG